MAHRIYFEYAPEFLDSGLHLSPFKLPLVGGLAEHTDRAFGPLHGLFDDSLPDGWGLLLMDRHFRANGIDISGVTAIDRLAYLGTRTMGALTYHPEQEWKPDNRALDLLRLERNAHAVFSGAAKVVLPELMCAGGSPGGARPKVLVGLDEKGQSCLSGEGDLPRGFAHWMVKFASQEDARDAGPIEYAYALMAKCAGVTMPDVQLMTVKEGRTTSRFFAVKRFDRGLESARHHVHTLGNMVYANFRIPSLDYADIFKVTRALTRDHRDVLALFRLMAFNVAARNRADHAKNFAFILDASTKDWSLAPAYDLTFSAGPGGEQSMSVAGEGKAPTKSQLITVAEQTGIRRRDAEAALGEVAAALAHWREFADQAQCTKKTTDTIARAIGFVE